MLIVLRTLLGTLSSIFRSRAVLALENLALRYQIGVLQRSARKRFKLTVPTENIIAVEKSQNQQHPGCSSVFGVSHEGTKANM